MPNLNNRTEPYSRWCWGSSSWLPALVFILLCCISAGLGAPFSGYEPGASVVVIYNTRVPESKEVADYYAQRRQVPEAQVIGFDLPTTESMTRDEFVKKLQLPLWHKLLENKLFVVGPFTNAPVTPPLQAPRRVMAASFRYLVLCYGVPVRVLPDTNLVEAGTAQIPENLRRNEASVDSDLACLPLTEMGLRWTGPNVNPFFGATNAASFHPVNGILMVTRLDGPSPAIARGLVDKAMEAETNGLWGRAYFDTRGVTDPGYKPGDDMFRAAAALVRGFGFETEVDEKLTTFSVGYPMSHIAIYGGWYDEHVSGPFARPQVEFVPGAFAYHLHSFSAQVLRTTNQHWVGPLLQKGATITLGSVAEPYLVGTPDIAMFLGRFIFSGFSFGEAAYAAQNCVSWQNIAVGDPLYRPFGRDLNVLQAELEQRGSKWAEFCQLRKINLQQAKGADPEDLVLALEQLPLTRKSAVLTEKLADVTWKAKKLSDSIETYKAALKLDPSPQQKIRLLLTLAEKQAFYGPDQVGYDAYQRFLREVPDYPEPLPIYEKLLTLARKLDKKEDVTRFEQMIRRLSPPPPTPKP